MRLTCRSSLFTPWLSLLLSVTLLLSLAVCIPSVALALPTQQYEPTAINFDSAVVDDRSDGDSGHVAKRSQDINGTDVTLDPRAREGVYCHHPNAGNSGQCFLSWDRLWDLRKRVCSTPSSFGFNAGRPHATWVTNCPGPIGIYFGSDSQGNLPNCWDRISDTLQECLTDGRTGSNKFADGTAWHHDGEVYKAVRYTMSNGDYVNQKGPGDSDALDNTLNEGGKGGGPMKVELTSSSFEAKMPPSKDTAKRGDSFASKKESSLPPPFENITGGHTSGDDGFEFNYKNWLETIRRYLEAEGFKVPKDLQLHRLEYEGHRYDHGGKEVEVIERSEQGHHAGRPSMEQVGPLQDGVW